MSGTSASARNLCVLRRETKYHISHKDYLQLVKKLSRLIQPDPHNQGMQGYFVRSLYFDSLDYGDYYDKQSGVYYRKKVRIRVYDPAQDSAKLELKEKFGVNQRKRSVWITREMARQIAAGNYSVMLARGNDLLDELFVLMTTQQYRPCVMVEYQRHAFVYPYGNVRITFDSHVGANYSNHNLFDPDVQFQEVTPEVIMEVKYSGYMPEFLYDVIAGYNAVYDSIGKYYNCMEGW